MLTHLDHIIIQGVKTTYHTIHDFLMMDTFGVPINFCFFGAFLVFFAVHELEHNPKVQNFLQDLAEKGYLKYLNIGFILLTILIVAI